MSEVMINEVWKSAAWRQYGAAIDMLEESVRACPDELWRGRVWRDSNERPEFWYIVYHTLFWIDVYLFGTEEGFLPPEPFLLIEQDQHGPMPERPYTREELLGYLEVCRDKCQATILALTEEEAARPCALPWGEVSFAELQLYAMHHVQEHVAQLNLFLGRHLDEVPDWISWAGKRR